MQMHAQASICWLKYTTIGPTDSFGPFEFQTNLVFRSPLYLGTRNHCSWRIGRFKLRLNIPGLGCMAGYCSAPQSLGRMDPNSGKIHGPCERQRLGPQLRNLSTNSAKFNDLSLYLKALLKIKIGFY